MEQRIERVTGKIREMIPIEKGFSDEKKWRILAENGEFLLRHSSAPFERKSEEFKLMRRARKAGVRCNEAIDLFQSDPPGESYSLFSYLPGRDAESCIQELPAIEQHKIGVQAGKDLKAINSISAETAGWYERKWKKHEKYLKGYHELGYRFDGDTQVLKFIEAHYHQGEGTKDVLLHDDFHLGNILIDNGQYGGILDFNRYEWGDPLHEFVKLEWFTWPLSRDFARGQVQGYFAGEKISDGDCLTIAVYIAMSIISTIVWTLKYHPHTIENIENIFTSILEDYRLFGKTRPDWAP